LAPVLIINRLYGDMKHGNHEGELMILHDETVKKITEQWAREAEKEERKLIRKQAIGKYYWKGWVAGIVWVAGFMARKGRKDIAQAIMKEAYLDREQCRGAISKFVLHYTQRSIAFSSLAGTAWGLR
jgi:hypothetical protein